MSVVCYTTKKLQNSNGYYPLLKAKNPLLNISNGFFLFEKRSLVNFLVTEFSSVTNLVTD